MGFAFFLAAVVLVSLPQSISQHEHFDSWTPLPGGSGLVGLEYTDGLLWQLYDTYVGGSPAEAQMIYLDHDTGGIIDGLKEGEVETTGQYAEVVIDNPVTMAGVFLRHLVNGLDERYSTPYVEHFEGTSNKLLRVAGFLLVFAALVRTLWGEARRRLGVGRARYLVALLLCAASSVASSVETRYMLPVFLLAAILVLAPGGWPSPVGPAGSPLLRYRPLIAILAAAVVFFGVVAIIVTATSNSLVLGAG